MIPLVLFACLPLMPRVSVALETELSVAYLALYPPRCLRILNLDYRVHAVRVGTKLLVARLQDLCIMVELLVFPEGLLPQNNFD
jgi:hypothetical protein